MAETLTLPECKAIVYEMLSQSPTLADNTIARCVDDISTDKSKTLYFARRQQKYQIISECLEHGERLYEQLWMT